MSHDIKHHISSYKSLLTVLAILIGLTWATVAVTQVELGALTVTGALLIASVKAFLVLYYFMHLKYEDNFLKAIVALVFIIFAAVIVITFVDYAYRV